jgi:pimeloyl-ACP methyl ester carboxylesterase
MNAILDTSLTGDPRNALVLAKACDLAYLSEATGIERFRAEMGLEARLISVNNTQVYVAQNDESIVVAFRGSEAPNTLDGFKDWLLTNANNYLILPSGQSGTEFASAGVGARFHRGFLDALQMVWAALSAEVAAAIEAKERAVWVTGHSLGGALALLAAWRFTRNFIAVQEVVTFGAPMIGNQAAAEAFGREMPGKIFRYVDLEDLVPHLPSVSLVANAYSHCLNEISMGAAEAAAAALASLGASRQAATDGTASETNSIDPMAVEQVWGMVESRIASHMIANYQARVEAKIKELA